MSSFYSNEELIALGLKKIGNNVLISRKVSIYGAGEISIGNNVRIDDFCILSGKITIGNYVHISAFCALYGKYGIKIGNFCGCSPRTTIFSATDDFSGQFMISPMAPEEYTNVTGGIVELENFVQLGANSIVMPNVVLGQGVSTGAFTFITESLSEWSIYVGIPARKIKDRKKEILNLVKNIREEIQ